MDASVELAQLLIAAPELVGEQTTGGMNPPMGYVFLTDSDGVFLTDSDGVFLIAESNG